MIATTPEVKATSRYSITETAKLLGISTRTVQRYINNKKITASYRAATNRRVISGTEIIKIWNATL